MKIDGVENWGMEKTQGNRLALGYPKVAPEVAKVSRKSQMFGKSQHVTRIRWAWARRYTGSSLEITDSSSLEKQALHTSKSYYRTLSRRLTKRWMALQRGCLLLLSKLRVSTYIVVFSQVLGPADRGRQRQKLEGVGHR